MSAAAALVDELAAQAFTEFLAAQPLYASQLGYREYISALTDISEAGRERRRAQLQGTRSKAAAIQEGALDEERRITRTMLLRQASDELLAIEAGADTYTVTPLPQTGAAAALLVSAPRAVLQDGADAEAYLQRLAAMPAWLRTATERLDSGAAGGRRPVQRLVRNASDQLTAYLDAPLTDDPLLGVPTPAGAAPDWRDRLDALVRDQVRPAFAAHRDHLRSAVLPAARSDDRPGLAALPDGPALYQRLAAAHTTTDLSAEQIHQTGVDLVAELTEEMRELGERPLGTSDFGQITDRLRRDPELYFTTSEEVAATAEESLRRAERALPAWLGLLPEAPCQVLPMPPFEVENGDLGHYQWPSRDGSRPGTYWINTYRPKTRPRFEAQTLAFHESVPGHHTQLAVCHELENQSEFRRHARVTAFTEGWALYCERLADEMGLYTESSYRLGMISFDFWRATRLVVDTGMHAMGWSRDAAVSYMFKHSALTRKNIENEVDRYIGWPGQALGYMLGRLQIRRLREQAEKRLGADFVLRDFHTDLIGHGSLPLSVLAEVRRALGGGAGQMRDESLRDSFDARSRSR